ncbi:MAG: S26 family signal peptidase [Pseudomonadota bacterium]|nr:S26 family signal peptidase [Pseudomonadota bacterium]
MAALTAISLTPLKINLTDSAPGGLWVEHQIDQSLLKHGMLVSICPPEKPVVQLMADGGYLTIGNCPKTQVAPLLKSIKALPGDLVRIEAGIPASVNGLPILNSIAKQSIPAWPDGEYIVQPEEVWIFSSYSASSFDSRYFGPVKLSAIRGEAAPLLVRGNMEQMK